MYPLGNFRGMLGLHWDDANKMEATIVGLYRV